MPGRARIAAAWRPGLVAAAAWHPSMNARATIEEAG